MNMFFKKCVSLVMAFLLMITLVLPVTSNRKVHADGVDDIPVNDNYWVEEPDPGYSTNYDEQCINNVVEEAKALGIPNAFYKHYFSDEYIAKNITAPSGLKYKLSTTLDNVEGIETNSVDTGVLANTKIDLGEYDFGNYKVGRVVYNMLAKKNLKGKGYLYFGNSTVPFAALDIKRTGDNELEATKSLSIDVRGAALSGKGHIYLRFEADSAKDSTGKILDKSGVKGFLYLESMFFTEGSNPVLDFDLDKEVNTIEQINGSKLHTTTGYGVMNVQVPSGYKSEYTDKTFTDETYELDYLKGRGNSTWQTDKKPYKVKLDKSVDMFGMGKCKHWVLLANYYDYTLMRNKFTYDLADRLGLKYSIKSVFVDVVISGEYCGCYQLSQQIRIDKNNVNIADLSEDYQTEEPGISGGYIFNTGSSWLTEATDTAPSFSVANYMFRIDKPEYEDDYPEKAKEAQVKYAEDYFTKIYNLVEATSADASANASSDASANASGNPAKENWRDYMDEQSIIDYYWIQEFSKNGDAYSGSSTYMFKDRNDKLYWGPIWDFDYVAWGADGTGYSQFKNDYTAFEWIDTAPFMKTLTKYDSEFKSNVLKRWAVFRSEMVNAVKDGGTIDQYAKKLYMHALANYQVRRSNLMLTDLLNGSDDDGNRFHIDASGDAYTLNYYNEVKRFKNVIREGLDISDRDMKYLGMDPVYQPAKFYVDDKLVANVNYNVEEMKFVESEIPADPVKDGYVFQGWYFTDDLGDECEFDVTSSIHKKVNAGTYIPLDVYAKFVPKNEYNNDVALTFNSDTYYVPLVSADGFKYTNYFDLKDYLGIYPYGINAKKIKWSYGPDEKHLTKLDESDSLSLEQEGTHILVADYKGNKAKAKIIVVNEENTYLPTDFKVKDSIKVSVNGVGNVGISFKKNDKKPSVNFYNHMSYKSEDYEIADVNDQGIVLGKKPGKTRIYSFLTNEDETVIVRSTEVIVGAALPGNAGIKSVKKSGKKVKVTLNKAEGSKGYQVAVYKTAANAKANKKALVKKYVTKTSFTLKSAKFKKCKKLYLKVRAYNMDGKTKQYSEWSDIKS